MAVGQGRLGGKSVDSRISRAVDQPETVEALAHVRPFPHRDDPLGTIGQLLAAGTQGQRGVTGQIELQVQKGLVQVEFVFIGRPRPAFAALFQAALQLAEEAGVFAHVQAGMQEVPLQEIAAVLRILAPVGMIEVFVAFPRLPAEREIPGARLVERYVFDRIPRIAPLSGIAEINEILVGAVELVGRVRSCRGASRRQGDRHHGGDAADQAGVIEAKSHRKTP